MAVLSSGTHDPEKVRAGLEAWFSQRWPAAQDLTLTGGGTFPGGLSSQTVRFGVDWKEDGASRQTSVVVRLPPSGEGVFRDYDLKLQAQIQSALAPTSIPVAEPIGYEADESWIGSDFLVMPCVDGKVPADNPPYPFEGWLLDLPEAARRTVIVSFAEVLGDIHRLDWSALPLAGVARAAGPGLEPEIAWWADYLDWSSRGAPPADVATVHEVLDWCNSNRPAEVPHSLVWGDARIGNLIYAEDMSVNAVLDWEMATIGPAELDLGWHFALRRSYLEHLGLESLPEMSGFPTVQEELECYEARLGRPVQDLAWYELFGAVRIGACVLAIDKTARLTGRDGLQSAASAFVNGFLLRLFKSLA